LAKKARASAALIRSIFKAAVIAAARFCGHFMAHVSSKMRLARHPGAARSFQVTEKAPPVYPAPTAARIDLGMARNIALTA
jgi:hypothetical protein